MLTRELARKGVKVADPLDRYEESLIADKPCIGQHSNLLAKLVLQFRHIDRMDGLPTIQIAPPFTNLFIEHRRAALSRHLTDSLW
jgi:hypothetical protein